MDCAGREAGIVSALEDQLAFQIRAAKLPPPTREHRFYAARRWRFDFAWPSQMLALEVDGGAWVSGRHTRGRGFEADCEKMSHAAIHGWTVLRVTGTMVRDGRALTYVEMALKRRMGS